MEYYISEGNGKSWKKMLIVQIKKQFRQSCNAKISELVESLNKIIIFVICFFFYSLCSGTGGLLSYDSSPIRTVQTSHTVKSAKNGTHEI